MGASPTSCAAGRAVLQVIVEEHLQENAKRVGSGIRDILERLHQKYEIVGEVRGRGMMQAIELVEDRQSKTPATKITAEVFEKTCQHGLVVSKSGANRNILRMVPPMCRVWKICLRSRMLSTSASAAIRCTAPSGVRTLERRRAKVEAPSPMGEVFLSPSKSLEIEVLGPRPWPSERVRCGL